MLGSSELLGLDDVSFDRYGRYAAYGYGENEIGNAAIWEPPSKVDWNSINWGNLQRQCVEKNMHRFRPQSMSNRHSGRYFRTQGLNSIAPGAPNQHKERTALLLRSFTDMTWTANDIYNLRSLVTELSLHSSGEYEVFLLVHVKNATFDIESPAGAALAKKQYIPREFHDISILFNDATLETVYPNVAEHRYAETFYYNHGKC